MDGEQLVPVPPPPRAESGLVGWVVAGSWLGVIASISDDDARRTRQHRQSDVDVERTIR